MSDSVALSIPLPSDDDGYLDRQCQFPECEKYFKVLEADWEARQPDVTYCPVCGYQAEAGSFSTHEQNEYAQQVALAYALGEIKSIFEGMAKRVNSRAARNRVLSIKMTTDFPDLDVPLSPEAAESLTMRVTCEHCACRFAVQGPGSFCPLCGENLATHTFRQAVDLCRSSVGVIQDALAVIDDPALAATAKTKLVEDQLGNLVSAFQHLGESLYKRLPDVDSPPPQNLFPRLEQASQAWQSITGRSLEQMVSGEEWHTLKKYFQQRHVLEHQSGIVDAKYADRTGDTTYRIGSRLVITPPQVLHMAALVEKLGLAMLVDVPTTDVIVDTSGKLPTPVLFPPQLPGTTAVDWTVYRAACEVAVDQDDRTLAGQSVWAVVSDETITEEDFADSLDILESKGLVSQYRTLGSSPLPRQLALAHRGLDLYFKHTCHDYRDDGKRIAQALLDGITTSDQICVQTGLSRLQVLHTLDDFVAYRFIPGLIWSAGVAYAFVANDVHLRRFVRE